MVVVWWWCAQGMGGGGSPPLAPQGLQLPSCPGARALPAALGIRLPAGGTLGLSSASTCRVNSLHLGQQGAGGGRAAQPLGHQQGATEGTFLSPLPCQAYQLRGGPKVDWELEPCTPELPSLPQGTPQTPNQEGGLSSTPGHSPFPISYFLL